MTVSVSNDDDDEEDKRFAFSPSFVIPRCTRNMPAAREVYGLSFFRFNLPEPGTPGPRGTSAKVESELICR